jgi:hypothetical protein
MIDPSSRLERELKAAEEFFELAKKRPAPHFYRHTIVASLSGIFHRRAS